MRKTLRSSSLSLSRHKASNQAYIRLNGRFFYFGTWGRSETEEAYHRFLAEYYAAGEQLPVEQESLTINELMARFWKHVCTYYVDRQGKPTQEQDNFRQAMRPLKELYGSLQVNDFTPLRLKAVREQMIEKGWCRRNINNMIARIKQFFRWGTENDLVSGEVYHALQAVTGLKRGRSLARETEPIKPAPMPLIEAVRPFVSRQVWAMIQMQLLTGARSGEICCMKPCDIDRTGKIWVYMPNQHKTAWHGHERRIYIGPRAQKVLMPFLLRPAEGFCFSPMEAEAERRTMMHAARRTRLCCGNRPGTNRRNVPLRSPASQYAPTAYARAISRALEQAFPPPGDLAQREGETGKQYQARLTDQDRQQIKLWNRKHHWHPHQLRHNAGTSLRKEFGLEAARIILGHRSVVVTSIYAEADIEKALEIMMRVG